MSTVDGPTFKPVRTQTSQRQRQFRAILEWGVVHRMWHDGLCSVTDISDCRVFLVNSLDMLGYKQSVSGVMRNCWNGIIFLDFGGNIYTCRILERKIAHARAWSAHASRSACNGAAHATYGAVVITYTPCLLWTVRRLSDCTDIFVHTQAFSITDGKKWKNV